ncbi:DUF930 domain-containing protein [Rhizobium tubonense]|uniref:DUF930 domain-containing protein n=1 Tax=Rhizobium tubonense TaxID=484088 RepID=A0A2W4ETQ9_9HYPH|nr:DUF930 domain-containing protein [Rhizobium tubonense]PZM13730.1 hypothetical protein CPY51_12670 [Rhizobium tubonense]
MQQDSANPKKSIEWGTPVSILIHVAIAAAFLVNLPAKQQTPDPEQAVNVELVPPPEEKKPDEKKPEEAKQEQKKPDEKKPEEKPPVKPPEPPKVETKAEEPSPPPAPPSPKEEAKKEEPEPEPPKEEAKAQPKPEPPKEQEEPKQEEPPKPEAEKQPFKQDFRSVEPIFGFGDKEAGPQLSDKGNAAETEAEPAVAQAPSQPDLPVPLVKPLLASPVPADINLPKIDAAASHAENDGPTIAGADEAKTHFEPDVPPKASQSQQEDASSMPTPPEKPPEDRLNRTKTLLSKKANSGSRAVTAIGNRSRDTRVGPLCVTELAVQLQQATPAYSTDGMPSYPPISANVVIVNDGAFLSDGVWYGLKFRCEVDDAATKVVSLQFSVGSPIPRNEWKRRHLSAD